MLLVIFKWLLNLLKCLIYHIIKDKKVCLRRVWIRLTTAYLLCAREFRQKMQLRFNFDACPMHSPSGFVHLTHQNLSARALFCLNSLAKVNTQLLIYNSYTPRTLRACCSQSKFRILKIRESSARALFLYNCTPNISRSADASVSVA